VDASAEIGLVAKLTDFGLSTRLDMDHTHVSNFTAGTAFYIAPEVVNCNQLTRASDVYSWVRE
jgi:serine/threonine protein kinase